MRVNQPYNVYLRDVTLGCVISISYFIDCTVPYVMTNVVESEPSIFNIII